MCNSIDRRAFITRSSLLLPALLLPIGCKGGFDRPLAVFDLGEVQSLLYTKIHIPKKQFLVYREEDGWRALSTRCTYRGCDLTFQEKVLFCSCCRSIFRHDGQVIRGPAKNPLPWVEIFYKDNHLYARTGKAVSPKQTFSTEEIESKIKEYGLKIADPYSLDDAKIDIPEVLQGGNQEEPIVVNRDELMDKR